MLSSARKAMRYAENMSRSDLDTDEKTSDAIVRNLEVLGEAAKHVPQHVRESCQEVPWSRLAGLRDVLAHGYFGVDLDIVWDVVSTRLPAIIPPIERSLREMGGHEPSPDATGSR
jgi:uncharacterized protein with HEPN domain